MNPDPRLCLPSLRQCLPTPPATHHPGIARGSGPRGRPRVACLRSGVLAAALAALAGCSATGPLQGLAVAAGLQAQWLCIDHFESGLPVAQARAERLQPLGVMAWVLPLSPLQVDEAARQISVRTPGGFSARARHQPGVGCTLLHTPADGALRSDAEAALPTGDAGAAPPASSARSSPAISPPAAPRLPPIAGPEPVPAASPALRAAVARAFAQPEGLQPLHTRAVVVLQHGRVIAEQYAPGLGPDTPLLAQSMSKSLTNALLGVLAAQGRLQPQQPAALAAWRTPGDDRAGITLAQLLQQVPGLAMTQTNTGWDDNARMLFIEPDPAGFAASRPLRQAPGTQWAYTDANYLLLARWLRDALTPAEAPAAQRASQLQQWVQQALAGPLGMTSLQLNPDRSGTPGLASMTAASARDWARLGQLFLQDGVLDGSRRLLPAGWVAFSRQPVPGTAYGAGWWSNARGAELNPHWGVPWGFASLPRDAFFARGFMGQFTVVVPSRQLVVVRMGSAHERGDAIEAVDAWLAQLLPQLPD